MNDSVLDVGCGVAHLHYLFSQIKDGKDNISGLIQIKKQLIMIDEDINAMHGTIEDTSWTLL